SRGSTWTITVGLAAVLALVACGSPSSNANSGPTEWPCEVPNPAQPPDYLKKTGCTADFQSVASEPLDASLPGARSGKVILDLRDNDTVYFQNSNKYEIHYLFAREYLNTNRDITTIDTFNPEYTAPLNQRRFLLGAVTYYEGPKVWALEIAPYDTSTPEMIARLFEAVKKVAFYGSVPAVHPAAENVEAQAQKVTGHPLPHDQQRSATIDYH